MTVIELGAFGEFVGSIVVMVTLVYLAIQVRQNTAQQKREETVSIQRGQNQVIAQMSDPAVVRAYALTAGGESLPTIADRSRAIVWAIQYLNQFQIVYDLHHGGTPDDLHRRGLGVESFRAGTRGRWNRVSSIRRYLPRP